MAARLAGARRRKRKATGQKVEGRKSHAEKRPEVVALAKALRRKKPKGGQMSLRAISAELAARGHVNERGKPFNPNLRDHSRPFRCSAWRRYQVRRDILVHPWAERRPGLPRRPSVNNAGVRH